MTSARTVARTVPLFAGVRRVVVPKKFSVRKVIDRALGRLADLYVKQIGEGI